MDNRHWLKIARGAAWGVVLGVAATAVAAAQGPPGGRAGRGAPPPLVVHQLEPNVYWVEGAGGNSGVIVGNNGVIVIDAKVTAAGGNELVADIAKITPKPVTTIFLTHSDPDHVNGLQSFPKGVTIIAQENCKTEMQSSPAAAPGGPLADYLPTRTVKRNMEDMTIDGVHLRAYHFAPAHTSGDLMVYLPDDKIMFTGDIVATQSPYPLIHLEKNGSSDGWITTMNGIVATDATTFVPGHGDPQMKTDLQKRVKDMMARRDQIRALVAQGKTLDEVRQSLGEQPPAARGGGGRAGAVRGPGGGGGGAGRGAGRAGAQRGGPGRGAFPGFQDFTGVIYAEQMKK
jgi:cyclase